MELTQAAGFNSKGQFWFGLMSREQMPQSIQSV